MFSLLCVLISQSYSLMSCLLSHLINRHALNICLLSLQRQCNSILLLSSVSFSINFYLLFIYETDFIHVSSVVIHIGKIHLSPSKVFEVFLTKINYNIPSHFFPVYMNTLKEALCILNYVIE